MTYLYSFLFAGVVCLIAQMILDNTKLSCGHITSLFVVTGAILDIGGIYDKIISLVGGGASVLITSFGHLLAHGALEGGNNTGAMGILSNTYLYCTAGITSVIIFSFFLALIFKPKH